MSAKIRISEAAARRCSEPAPSRRVVLRIEERPVKGSELHEETPRRPPTPGSARDAAPRVRAPSPKVISAPGILDAVEDQHGCRWIRYGTSMRSVWFAIPDLISDGPAVFRRLSATGASCLTSASQAKIKHEVEAHRAFRPALVATRPGWLQGYYFFGDGTCAAPRSDYHEVIVTFEPHPKFTPRGTLKEWKIGFAPFIVKQPLSHFVIGLALSGPLLRFVPRGYLNPQAELVGALETGKSSLAVLAASTWAGDPGSETGGGENWDMTLNSLDPLKLSRGDGFLFLDEANLAGESPKTRSEFARQATFKLAATGGKRRFGDPAQVEQVRLAMLSTTNTALADLVEGSPNERDAIRSRRITLRVARDESNGIFASVPDAYENALEASEAMVAVADECWGTAGRAFVEHLVREIERDESRFRDVVARALARYRRRDKAPTGSARMQKTFALVALAAELAGRWGILPTLPGSSLRYIQEVACASAVVETAEQNDPLAAIRAYVGQHRTEMIETDSLERPLALAEFEAAAGFLRRGHHGVEVMIPARRFQAAFQDHVAMMRALRASGQARTEGGQQSKLTIKTPRTICDEGRVYCIRLPAQATGDAEQP